MKTNDPSNLNVSQRLRFLAKDSVLYGGAAAFNQAFALITFPILTRLFSVEDYGVIDFFNVLAALLTIVFVFGQDSAVARFFYEHKEMSKRKQVISQALAFEMGVLLVFVPPIWFLSGEIAGWLSSASDAETLLKLVLLQVPFLLLINFSQNILKWTFSRTQFLLVSIGSNVFAVIALLIGVVSYDLGLVGLFVIYLATRAVFGFLGLWFVRHWLEKPRDWRFLREMMPYAAPFGVICTIAALVPAMERTFIVEFLGHRELGLFAAGAKVAILIALPIQAFDVAWGPFSLAIHKEADASRTYNWVLKAITLGLFCFVIALALVAEPVIQLLASNRYAGASIVVFPIALGLAIKAIGGSFLGLGIGLSKRSYLYLYGFLAHLVVSTLAIYVLIRAFGLAGVAWGAMLGYLAKSFMEAWLAQRAYPLPWAFSGVIGLGLTTIVIGLLSQTLIWTGSPLLGAVVRGMGLLVVPTLGWMVLFNGEERARIISVLMQFKIQRSRIK
jgi:O-antigen/teichoic acid export membrane protein